MTKEELALILDKHKKWLNDDPDGKRANLSDADLSDADLRGANIDFSCLPLWCGSLSAHFDDRQIIQIIYHAVKAGLNSPNVSNDVKTELSKLSDLSNKFHRVDECGMIEPKQEERTPWQH